MWLVGEDMPGHDKRFITVRTCVEPQTHRNLLNNMSTNHGSFTFQDLHLRFIENV